MDYSKYYLKNYMKYQKDEEDYYAENQEVADDKQDYDYSESANTSQSKHYYTNGGRVEIEVVPQLTSMVETNYSIDNDDVIVDIEPQPYNKQENRRKGLIMTLAIVTCLLIAFVVGDFASNGALIASITSLYKTQEVKSQEYYALVLKSCDSYQQARIYSDQMRLQGGAGYIVKNGDNYMILADIYDDLQEANNVVEKNSGSSLVSYGISNVDYAKSLKGGDELLISMGGYTSSITQQLSTIGESLAKLEIDKSGAIEKIQSLLDNLQMQYDEIKDNEYTNNNITMLLGDISTTIGLLENLVDSTASRPNLICDIRYTKIQLIINYEQLAKKMAE